MSIKAGQLLIDANGFIVDRIQTGGVSQLNIPVERIYEVGNFETVGLVYDIPDLTFEVQSYDVSTEIEAILMSVDPTTTTDGHEFDFNDSIPIDVISPFRSSQGVFTSTRGVVIPYLTLENVTYRFGVGRTNAEETFTLRGDSIYYVPGSPVQEHFTKGGLTTHSFANGPALVYHEAGVAIYALCVWWHDPVGGLYQRLFHGQDYTDTSSGITLTNPSAIPTTAIVQVCYGTAATVNYPQSVNAASTVKPAAVRGKDIDVYISDGAATPTFSRLTSVQNLEVTRRVTLQNDEEFGNAHYVATDYLTAEVSGTLGIKGYTPSDLIAKIQQLGGVDSAEIAGPLTAPAVAMELRIHHPSTGVLLKTIYVPDASFTAPPIQGRQQAKLETTFKWESVSGAMQVYQGAR